MKRYLIVLNGSNEALFKLVDVNVWEWMMNGRCDEDVPNFISNHPDMGLDNEEFENMHFGTVNDRANGVPGQFFTTNKELQDYINKNYVEIIDRYIGVLE